MGLRVLMSVPDPTKTFNKDIIMGPIVSIYVYKRN